MEEKKKEIARRAGVMGSLMLVFMFVAVIVIRNVVGDAAACGRLYQELRTEFQTDFEAWDVELREDLTIRFRNPDVLFDNSEHTITARFQATLRDFFPRYVSTLQALENPQDADTNVREIRIEAHTSRRFDGSPSTIGKYLGNLTISQRRAESVVNFVLGLPEATGPDGYADWAIERIAAIGLSSSKPRNEDDDDPQSRRVEFRAIAGACERASVSEREYWAE